MNRNYFILWYRLDRVDSYLIWYTNDFDGVVVDNSEQVIMFKYIPLLRKYADKCGLHIEEEEPGLHNLDAVKDWIENPSKTDINCDILLSAWNLFIDIASSVQDVTFDRDREKTDLIYEKLFWGNNLPAVTPPGKHYKPNWTDDEIEKLQEVLADGLKMFQQKCIESTGSALDSLTQ